MESENDHNLERFLRELNSFPQKAKLLEERIAAFCESLFTPLRQLENYLNENKDQIREGIQLLLNVYGDIPGSIRIAHQLLARHGWFISLRWIPIERLSWIAKHGDNEFDNVQKYIMDHMESISPNVMKSVSQFFPDREKILQQAFDAHFEGKYALSIPTMLAQADGMFFEVVGSTFFKNKAAEREKIKRRVLKTLYTRGNKISISSIANVLLCQLDVESTLHESFGDFDSKKLQDPDYNPLNRNRVLHGLSTDYCSLENSMRAIALIDLLCDAKRDLAWHLSD